jgi:hypothetical protein
MSNFRIQFIKSRLAKTESDVIQTKVSLHTALADVIAEAESALIQLDEAAGYRVIDENDRVINLLDPSANLE